METREQNAKDLLTLLEVLYKRGPRSLLELNQMIDNDPNVCAHPISESQLDTLVDHASNVVEWLGLS